MSLSASAASQELSDIQKRTEDRLAKQGSGNAALTFAKDVKQSLLFQYDWADLLSAAPLCLSLMGSCYVAATCPEASGMSLKDCMPASGFKKISHPELRACLIQVSDAGRFAFIEAEKKMDLIASQSTSIGQWLTQIGTYLSYLPAPDAAANLNKKLTLVKEGSDNALKYSQDIERKFLDWLELVCEVHEVTVAKEEKTSIDQQDGSIKLEGLSIESELTETSLKHAEEAAKVMKGNMDDSKKIFEKAADAIPTPLEQIGLQLVSNLAQTATTVIAQGLPMLMMGPAGGLAAGVRNNGVPQAPANKPGKRGAKTVSSQLNVAVGDPSDPAYRVASEISPTLALLGAALGVGTDKGVDWEHLTPSPVTGQKPAKDGFTFISTTLHHSLQSTQWTNGEASKELKAALTKLDAVLTEIKTEVAKDKQLMSNKASAKSPLVKKWQDTAIEGQATATKLVTTASAFPGSAPGSAPLIGVKPAASAGSSDQTGLNASLQSAQDKLNVTEAAYMSTQTNYQKAVESRSKVEGELARIKSELKNLELSQAKLEQIKKILRQCIGMIIQMKQQITNLVRFFSALSAMVEHVVKTQVRDFLDQVDTAKTVLIANVSLSDMARQELYTTTLMTQAYFSLFATIANMYKKISVNHVMPGIAMCDTLSLPSSDPTLLNRKMQELNAFTDNAQKAVQDEVAKAQKSVTDTLEQRVSAAQEETKLLPPPRPAVRLAIESGKNAVTDAVAATIDSTENPIVAVDTGISMNDL